jgi:hypothetical protein
MRGEIIGVALALDLRPAGLGAVMHVLPDSPEEPLFQLFGTGLRAAVRTAPLGETRQLGLAALLFAAGGKNPDQIEKAIMISAHPPQGSKGWTDQYGHGVIDAKAALDALTDAGEILIGQHTPFSAANFVIGCPASLPTSGFAHVSSGITAEAFLKRTAVARADETALRRMAPSIVALADHEGFPAHANAIRNRFGGDSTSR